MPGRVLFYVQHLLGIGHVKRAAAIVRAMTAAGQPVTVVLGGPDVPGISFGNAELLRLPAVIASDESFNKLVEENGREIDDAWRARRREELLGIFASHRPDILLIEMFPFGRRQFRFELIPLMEAARARRPRALIACSVRDILVRKPRAERNREMVETAREWFDLVLVHGDPNLVALEASFPEAAGIADLIRYTGYVVDKQRQPSSDGAGNGEVIVSAGGGAVGAPLLHAALTARDRCRAARLPWRLITGPNMPETEYRKLSVTAPTGVFVERMRPDLPRMLARCALSISQGGYNTVMDILRSRARAIIVPFAAGNESEQTLRAQLLQQKNLIWMVEAEELSPDRLGRAVDDALAGRPAEASGINLSGTEGTARILGSLRVTAR